MSYAGLGGGGHHGGGGGGGGGHHGGGGFHHGGGGRGFRGGRGGGWGPGYWDGGWGPDLVVVESENPCTQPWLYSNPDQACAAFRLQQSQRIAGFGSLSDDFTAGGWKWFAGGILAAVLARGIL